MAYSNPVLPGFNPDPSIVRVDRDYFLVTSSFEYLPGIPIYHSQDLIRWSLIGHALSRPSQIRIHTPEPGGGVWAPTIRHHQGSFYVVAASFDRYRPQDDDRVWPRGFYVKTDNVWDASSWSDPVFFDQVGFDQDVCLTPSGDRNWNASDSGSSSGTTTEPLTSPPPTASSIALRMRISRTLPITYVPLTFPQGNRLPSRVSSGNLLPESRRALTSSNGRDTITYSQRKVAQKVGIVNGYVAVKSGHLVRGNWVPRIPFGEMESTTRCKTLATQT